jgi:hypothetical protein
LNGRAGSVAAYSLIAIGLFWLLYGTFATIQRSDCNCTTTGPLVPIVAALAPLPGTTVTSADYSWNLLGVLLVSLGLLSYACTRERRRLPRFSKISKVAIVGAAVVLFFGLFVLTEGLQDRYLFCHLPGLPPIPPVDCSDVLSFPGVALGAVTTALGSAAFTALTLSAVVIVRPRR